LNSCFSNIGYGKTIMSFRIFRMDFQCPLERGDRLLQLSLLFVDIPNIIISAGIVWLDLDGLLIFREGFVIFPLRK